MKQCFCHWAAEIGLPCLSLDVPMSWIALCISGGASRRGGCVHTGQLHPPGAVHQSAVPHHPDRRLSHQPCRHQDADQSCREDCQGFLATASRRHHPRLAAGRALYPVPTSPTPHPQQWLWSRNHDNVPQKSHTFAPVPWRGASKRGRGEPHIRTLKAAWLGHLTLSSGFPFWKEQGDFLVAWDCGSQNELYLL